MNRYNALSMVLVAASALIVGIPHFARLNARIREFELTGNAFRVRELKRERCLTLLGLALSVLLIGTFWYSRGRQY